jgi:dipeptidyl aminopeptidase/acylaminoacyl peptidase
MASNRFNISIQGIDEATGNYYVVTDKFSDKAAVYFYDPEAREFSEEPLLAHPEYSATGVVLGTSPDNYNQLLGFSYAGPSTRTYWLDPTLDSIQTGLEQAYPDTGVSLIDWSDDFSRVLFATGDGANPTSYHILRDRSQVQTLGESRPWFDDVEMREPELVYYEARDGMRIPGILTLPAGWTREDGPLPAVVLPHGGPWARDSTSWDASGWPQFLATRGYAVLQPQYRGSTGWGRELWLAGDAQWGLSMQDDKDDGAAWLVEEGIADPDRIAIFGYSYGGFAAIAATVREDGPFQCAIAGAGVSDLTRLGNNWSDNRLQRIIQGQTVTGMDPMRNTERANIPILLYHGDRDVRVPLFHSRNFYNAIEDRVDAELLVVEDMPHSLPWYPRHHRETLAAIERFLADDCGPGGL